MKKGIIVGLIALTLLVGAFFIMLPQVLPQASEPDPELKFAGCNLSFADTIYVKYAVKGNDLSGVKLLVWTDPQSDYSYGSQNYVLNSIWTEMVSGAQCLVFQYNKLAAKQMGDVIYARAFVEKQGNAYYSEVKKYSVLQYVYNKTGRTGTASTNQKLIDLLEAMLEYGAKAQIYTNYKTNRLVSANYYQVNVVGGTLPDGCDSGLYAIGETVTLTAPSTDLEGNAFSYWENDDGENVGTTATLDVTVISRNRTYTAVYGVETPVSPDPEYSTGLAYTDNGNGTCTITGIGTCTDLDVLIPPSIDGLTVSAIGEKAFENQTTLTSIVIPDTVTSIGRRAFYYCTGLTEFTIPSSVTSIGTQIFFHADNIHTVYYNSSYYPLTETENQLFSNAGITKVVFGGTYIGSYATRNLGMNGHVTEVEIRGNVRSVTDNAFYGCDSLTSIVIPDSVTSISKWAFIGCTNIDRVYYSGTMSGWCHILFGVDSGIAATDTIPSSNPCRYGASLYINGELLTEAVIPNDVSYIGDALFFGCSSLTSIEIPNSVSSIGKWAFSGCTNLTSIGIPDTVTKIQGAAFYGCTGLTSIEIPTGVTTIENLAFAGCTWLTSVTIPDSVTSIGDRAFYGCTGLTSVTIPDSVTSIGQWFSYCRSLTEITIPDSVTSIGDRAFYGCTGLTSVTIPDSVTSIGGYAFYGCTSLANVEIPDSVTNVWGYAFCGCASLTNITIPNSVTSIENSVFSGCTSLTEITIPDSVTSIGRYAFSNCTGLVSIEIPDSVTSIGEYAFNNCTSMTEITIPESVTSIGDGAFSGCASLTDVYYGGTSSEWSLISIASGNEPLLNATLHCYTPPAQMIAVSFVDFDGVTVLREEMVEAGTAATPPVAPYRAGYIFDGWSPDYTGATTDIITVAQYTVNTEPTLTVKSVETASNETVEVKIMIDNNPGILGMQFSVNYDSTALTLTNAANGSAMSALLFTPPSRYRTGCTFLWEGVSVTGDDISDGEVLTLTFEINEAASSGDYAIEITNSDGNAFDNDMNVVELNVINGIVRVTV